MLQCKPLRFWLVPVAVLLTGCKAESQPPHTGVRTVPITRIVRIPAVALTEPAISGAPGPANLAILPGAADELPQGPEGFDVLDDESLVVTDPLRKRIAVFDRTGAYRSERTVGFATNSVTHLPDGSLRVIESKNGTVHIVDSGGGVRDSPAPAAVPPEVRLTGANSATVGRPQISGGRGGPLEIRLETPGVRLLSVESLGTGEKGDTYVALETTTGGDSVDLSKIVRRYAADGRPVCETSGMPLDYYIRPVDEIRVRRGVVYQLMPTNSEVRINVWNTN